MSVSVRVDPSLRLSTNEENKLGSYIVYLSIVYNIPFNVDYFTVSYNANVPSVLIVYLCVCFMFKWHMSLATDPEMSVKFYLLTVNID